MPSDVLENIIKQTEKESKSKLDKNKSVDPKSNKNAAGPSKENKAKGNEGISLQPDKNKTQLSKVPEQPEAAGLDKFSQAMEKSFNTFSLNLQKSMETMGMKLAEHISGTLENCFEGFSEQLYQREPGYQEESSEGEDERNTSESCELLDSITDEFECGDKVGPELPPALAKLANKFLSEKMNDSFYKNKTENYLIPKNLLFGSAPKVNKPVWDAMGKFTRKTDSNSQSIQNELLKSSLPTIQVISKLYEAKDDPSSLEINDLIIMLTDSLAFVGSANHELIKKRKDCIKSDLPKNMQGLCRESGVSPAFLFGDDLNAKIKEVSELHKLENKVSNKNPKQSYGFTSYRGRSSNRGFRGRSRFRPYNFSGRYQRKGPLNRRGSSKD